MLVGAGGVKGRVKSEGGEGGGCEGRGRDESMRSEHVGGGVWKGAKLERRGGGTLAGGSERQDPH